MKREASSDKKIRIILLVIVALMFGAVAWSALSKKQKTGCRAFGIVDARRRIICSSVYVGLSKKEAVSKAKAEGLSPAIIEGEGKDTGRTDFRMGNRIFLTVENGKVTKAEFQP